MKQAAVTKKPAIDTDAALRFAAGEAKQAQAIPTPKPAAKEATEAGKRVFFAPDGDKRLTINIRQELHKRLKLLAVEQETNIGDILEKLIEAHLDSICKQK